MHLFFFFNFNNSQAPTFYKNDMFPSLKIDYSISVLFELDVKFSRSLFLFSELKLLPYMFINYYHIVLDVYVFSGELIFHSLIYGD